MTRSSSGITLQTVSEDLEESQLWIITNVGTTAKADGRNLEDGVYYINNLSSRTFLTVNNLASTAPSLQAGTEGALGNRMAWYVQFVGGGRYMIQSVLRPGYYLTVSSSGVALEFLSDYAIAPGKALFSLTYDAAGGLMIKSDANYYLVKSSPSLTTLDSYTSVSNDLGKWRICLRNNYFEQTAHRCFYTQVQTAHSINIKSFFSEPNTTWGNLEDFSDFVLEYDEYATIDDNGTITGLKSGYTSVTAVHIPTKGIVEIGIYVYDLEDTKTQRMTRDVDDESTYCVAELYNGEKLWFVFSDDGSCSKVYTLTEETWAWLNTNYNSFVSNSGSPFSTEYCIYQAKQKIDLQMQNGELSNFSPTSDEYHGLWLHFSLVECNFREDLCHYLGCVDYVASCLNITNTLTIEAYNIGTRINTVRNLTQSQYRAGTQTIQILRNTTNTQAIADGITDVSTFTGYRPNWRESELYVFSTMYTPNDGYLFNSSYILDEQGFLKKVNWGYPGSIRPDLYNPTIGHCVDVKNYTVTTSSSRNNLVNNVVNQYNQRSQIFPTGTTYEVVIDVRGQSWVQTELDSLSQTISNRTDGNMTVTFLKE